MDESESMAREPLPSAEVDRLIDRELPGWRREDRGIRKRFQRATFPAAIESSAASPISPRPPIITPISTFAGGR